jgi:hypothetical protein
MRRCLQERERDGVLLRGPEIAFGYCRRTEGGRAAARVKRAAVCCF